MAQKNLTRLNVALTALTGGYESGLKKAGKVTERFGESVKKKLLSPLSLLTATLSTGAIVAGIKSTATALDGISKQADTLRTSTEALMGLNYAAELNGSSQEKMAATISEVTKRLGEAEQGGGEALKWIEKLGLSTEELARMKPDQVIGIYADKIKELPTAAMQAEAANRLLGDSSGELIPLLKGGSEGLAAMTKEAEGYGLTVSRVDTSKIEAANDALTKAGGVFTGILNKLTVKLAPFVEAFATAFADAGSQANGFGSTIDTVFNYAVKGIAAIADAWDGVRLVVQSVKYAFSKWYQFVAWVYDKIASGIQWVGTKVVQASDVIVDAFGVAFDFVRLGWAKLKSPVAVFIQFVSKQLSNLLHKAAETMSFLDEDLAVKLQTAANKIGTATGTMAADAKNNAKAVGKELDQTIGNLKHSTTALFSTIDVAGSETAQKVGKYFKDAASNAAVEISNIRNSQSSGTELMQFVANTEAKAQIAAEARTAELEQVQVHYQQLSAAEMQHLEDLRAQRKRDEEKRALLSGKYNAQILSGSSSFFANLSQLQQSHSKSARRIGKIAAKAKIATDTASAAMAAYKSLAGIPIVGPGLAAAASAAAILAGGIQMRNAENETMGGGGAPAAPDTSTGNNGGIATPAQPTQNIIYQGSDGRMSVDDLIQIYAEAKERGVMIGGISRG